MNLGRGWVSAIFHFQRIYTIQYTVYTIQYTVINTGSDCCNMLTISIYNFSKVNFIYKISVIDDATVNILLTKAAARKYSSRSL